MPEMDIRTSAGEVIDLLQAGNTDQAVARLEALRQDQALVVREALDRYVAAGAADALDALRAGTAQTTADPASLAPTLSRLDAAMWPPRMPDAGETAALSQEQRHDVYASIVATRGDASARSALEGQDRVIVGLRDETRTTDARGRGVYDDRIVVLWQDSEGRGHAREFHQATTEPTAQYDAHAKTSPRSPGFENVATRSKTEGEDVNGDRLRDLGRLAEGTVEMLATTHPRNRHPDEFSLRPTDQAVAAGAGMVQRDTNADGWFDARDTQGVQQLNNTFKIHRGSNSNTDSAGCQTIGGGEYDAFVREVRATPGQDRWQYVLTSVAPGQAPVLGAPVAVTRDDDPRQPGHPDHALQQQISGRLQQLGEPYAEHAEQYSLVLLHRAKSANLTDISQITPSHPTDGRAAGETLFLVQGRPGDPAAQREGVTAAEVLQTPPETSLQLLAQQAQAAQPAVPEAPVQQRAAPAMGVH